MFAGTSTQCCCRCTSTYPVHSIWLTIVTFALITHYKCFPREPYLFNITNMGHYWRHDVQFKEHYVAEELFFLILFFIKCSLSDTVTLVKSSDRSCGKLFRIFMRYFLCSSRGFPCSVRLYSCGRHLKVCRTLPSSLSIFPWRYIIFKLENSANSLEIVVNLLKDRSSHVKCSGCSITCSSTIM